MLRGTWPKNLRDFSLIKQALTNYLFAQIFRRILQNLFLFSRREHAFGKLLQNKLSKSRLTVWSIPIQRRGIASKWPYPAGGTFLCKLSSDFGIFFRRKSVTAKTNYFYYRQGLIGRYLKMFRFFGGTAIIPERISVSYLSLFDPGYYHFASYRFCLQNCVRRCSFGLIVSSLAGHHNGGSSS